MVLLDLDLLVTMLYHYLELTFARNKVNNLEENGHNRKKTTLALILI
jgi:hypothetical protein